MALKNPRSVTLMIEESQVQTLSAIAEKEKRSLAQVIRFAIQEFLVERLNRLGGKERKAR